MQRGSPYLPLFFTDPQAGFNNMLRAYHDIVLADSAKKAYRHFFDVLLENSDEGRSCFQKQRLVDKLPLP